jgi:phage repressor protein C with HTH and peptisase S24 domain/DNA-binding XRE family transcriptional regulator
MKTISEIIKQARQAAGISQSELARRLKITPQSVQAWESGRSTPRPLMYVDISEALNISLESLLTTAIVGMGKSGPINSSEIRALRDSILRTVGPNTEPLGQIDAWDDAPPPDDGEVYVPFLDDVYVPFLKEVELSAGSGKTVVEQSKKQKLRFWKMTLRRQGVQPSEAVCVTVSGNSMEPVLPDKSVVGVDQGNTTITDGKMYALNHGGQLRVKTLFRLPGGGVRLRSFNRDDHPDEEYTPQQMIENEITIIGRVFWSSVLW